MIFKTASIVKITKKKISERSYEKHFKKKVLLVGKIISRRDSLVVPDNLHNRPKVELGKKNDFTTARKRISKLVE